MKITGSPFRAIAAVLAVGLAGCAVSDDSAWEAFRDKAARDVDGRTVYIVEFDQPLTLSELRTYYDTYIVNDGLGSTEQASIVGTVEGVYDKWPSWIAQHIGYCVANEFGSLKARVVSEMAQATRAWEVEAHVNFEYMPQQDSGCNSTNTAVQFAVRPWTGGTACSPLPSGARGCAQKSLLIDYSFFDNDQTLRTQWPAVTTVGVLRHELGHILGLRHENLFWTSTCHVTEDGTYFPVNPTFDPSSAMNIPCVTGSAGADFSISNGDVSGIRKLYGASLTPDDVRFHVGEVDVNDPGADILQTYRGWSSIPTCRYTGGGFSCTNPSATMFDWGDPQQEMLIGDFNGDHRTDVVQAYRKWQSYPTCLSSATPGGWTCSNAPATIINADDTDEQRFLVGKFDGDSTDDIVQVTRQRGSLPLCKLIGGYPGGLTWTCNDSPATIFNSGSSEQQFLVGEVDGPSSPTADVIQTWRGWTSIPVCHSNAGAWSCDNYQANIVPTSSWEMRFMTGDFNGDGRTDVIQTQRDWGDRIPTCLAAKNKAGTFLGWNCTDAAATIYDSGSFEQQFLTGDFNGDGKTDVVQAYRGWSSLPLCVSTGTGWSCSNQPATIRNSGSRRQRFVAADVDHDGRTDVIQIHPAWSSYTVCFSRPGVWDCQTLPAQIFKLDSGFAAASRLVDDVARYSPGAVSVAAVKDGQIVWSRAAGMANPSTPATPDVPFRIASISKVFVATAALQLMDSSGLNPNASTGLVNPNVGAFPTLAQFANHTSGITGGPVPQACFDAIPTDPPTTLGPIIDACVATASPDPLWTSNLPGQAPAYANFNAAWVARRAEVASGRDFAELTREQIFQPLGMTHTGWFMSDLPGQQLAVGFVSPTQTYSERGISPYPVGNLRSSANDLARFMIMWTSGGSAFGAQLLRPGRVDYGLTLQAPAVSRTGFFWAEWFTLGGHRVWSHGGKLAGGCTRIAIDPVTREGFVILLNASCTPTNETYMNVIEDQAFRALDEL